MTTHKISYQTKVTRSNNTYIDMATRDEHIFLQTVLSVNSYMQELCLSQDPAVVQIAKWYRTPDKRYPYNKRLDRRNTPESMLSGLLNNILFGTQKNLSLEQLPFYEEIINTCVELIEELRITKKIDLQSAPAMTKIVFGLGI